MLASKNLIQAFNQQIGHELSAFLQYLSVASYFSSETLPELARLFYDQANEEREHAMKFVKFIVDVGGKVEIPDLAAPKSDFKSAEEAVSLAVEWEKRVTQQIYDLVDLARKESNYIALRFLDWFVTEQLEEVAKMSALLQVIRRAGKEILVVENYLAREGHDLEGPASEGS